MWICLMDGQPHLSWVKASPFIMIETFQSMPLSSIARLSEDFLPTTDARDASKKRVFIISTTHGKPSTIIPYYQMSAESYSHEKFL